MSNSSIELPRGIKKKTSSFTEIAQEIYLGSVFPA